MKGIAGRLSCRHFDLIRGTSIGRGDVIEDRKLDEPYFNALPPGQRRNEERIAPMFIVYKKAYSTALAAGWQ